jgi:glycosyltransferase involved in cell wall biosynthesis
LSERQYDAYRRVEEDLSWLTYTGGSIAHMIERQDTDELWVVIAAFNEALVIRNVVSAVRSLYQHVVVVDDGSRDATAAEALAAGAVVLVHPFNLGQGAALQTGITFALSEGAVKIVTFDADGQHAVSDIAVLVAAQRENDCDVVLGSRFLGRTVNMPRVKRLALKAAILLTSVTTGVRLTDAHNGLRLLTRRAANSIRLRQNRMAHASEILEQIRRAGLSYVEAPVTITYTTYSLRKGQSIANSFYIIMELIAGRLGG